MPADAVTALRDHPWIAAAEHAAGGLRLTVDPAALAPGPEPGGLVAELLDQWGEVYDETYAAAPGEDLSGWRATDTGAPFPAAHMAEWVERTAELVLRGGARRVLEVGSGTGLLARRLHPHLDAYAGIDPAPAAVARLRAAGLPGVTAARGAAHQLRAAAAALGWVPDRVLLNSVTQCFPDRAYLSAVLADAVAVVAPGGTVVVGDVRHAGLHLAWARWAERARDPGAGAAEIDERARRRAARDEELLADPAAVARAVEDLPRPVAVAVHARALTADTELSRYRFDAVLTVDAAPGPPPAVREWCDVGDGGLAAALAVAPVRVRGIPNGLLVPAGRTPAELRAATAGRDAAVLLDPADPARLEVVAPAAAAAVPAGEVPGPGAVHEPLRAFARRRVRETARTLLRRTGTAPAAITVVLPGDPPADPPPPRASAPAGPPTAPPAGATPAGGGAARAADDGGLPGAGQGEVAAVPPASAGAAAEAHAAGMAAVAGVDPGGLPGAMGRLDEVALRAMAVTLREGRALPGTAAEAAAALGAAPRHAWIVRRWLDELVASGWARRGGDGRVGDLRPVTRAELAAGLDALDGARAGLGYPAPLTRFFREAIDELPRLLRDEVPLQALLFPDGDVSTALGTYQDNTINRYLNAAAGAVLRRAAAGRPAPLRVLELGAGVGGTTATVLDALGEAPVDYLFTDVSPFFLDAARARFGDHPGLRHGLVDVNGPLPGQGLPAGGVDVVLAANVAHNAVHVPALLAGLRALLAPGGLVAIVESTREHYQALTSMLFLMSPRPGAPRPGTADARAGTDRIFLTRDEWRAALAAAGFRPVLDLPPPGSPLAALAQHLFVAAAPDPDRSRP